MRRTLSLLLLGAAALGAVAASPAPAPDVDRGADTDDVIVCVRFRDYDIPFTGITLEKPAQRFCVESGDLPGRQQ